MQPGICFKTFQFISVTTLCAAGEELAQVHTVATKAK